MPLNAAPEGTVGTAMEQTCALCGTVYRGKAVGGLKLSGWERRGEVLYELRWCLCQRGREGREVVTPSVAIAHPEYGDNVVLLVQAFAQHHAIVTIERVTARFWIGPHGAKYRRDTGHSPGGGYGRERIHEGELPRLEAWAAKASGKGP